MKLVKTPNISTEKIVQLYQSGLGLRMLSREAGIDHHRIKRILTSEGVDIRDTYTMPPFTEEHKRKIGEKSKGRVSKNKGIPATNEMILRYISARIEGDIVVDHFDNAEKLKILTKLTSKRKPLKSTDAIRQAFLDKFYFDEAFSAIYDLWLKSGKCKWHRPTLDHITPLSKGGGWELENLQFLTWFENRAKASMTGKEWADFKRKTNTNSNLFVENILNGLQKR